MKTNTLVTSEDDRQIQAIVDSIGLAVRRTARIESKKTNKAGRQRVLAQGGQLISELEDFVAAKITEFAEQKVGCLKLISDGTEIIIGATDGKSTITHTNNTFCGYVDPDFVRYGTDTRDRPTSDTKVQVFEQIKDGTFAQIFGGFGENRDRLCLTQNQIIRFVNDHSNWLRKDDYGTFFLFKKKGKFFIVDVRLDENMIEVYANHLLNRHVWDAEFRSRFVVPQL